MDIPHVQESGAMIPSPKNAAITIACMGCEPYQPSPFYNVPTTSLSVTDIQGRHYEHPLVQLCQGQTPFGMVQLTDPIESVAVNPFDQVKTWQELNGLLVMVDDLDIRRNWELPPDYCFEGIIVQQFVKNLRYQFERGMNPSSIQIHCVAFSEVLGELQSQEYFEEIFEKKFHMLMEIWNKNITEHPAHGLLRQKYVARKTRGLRRDRQRLNLGKKEWERNSDLQMGYLIGAARHLANYAAQWSWVREMGFAAYIPLYDDEMQRMLLFEE